MIGLFFCILYTCCCVKGFTLYWHAAVPAVVSRISLFPDAHSQRQKETFWLSPAGKTSCLSVFFQKNDLSQVSSSFFMSCFSWMPVWLLLQQKQCNSNRAFSFLACSLLLMFESCWRPQCYIRHAINPPPEVAQEAFVHHCSILMHCHYHISAGQLSLHRRTGKLLVVQEKIKGNEGTSMKQKKVM